MEGMGLSVSGFGVGERRRGIFFFFSPRHNPNLIVSRGVGLWGGGGEGLWGEFKKKRKQNKTKKKTGGGEGGENNN